MDSSELITGFPPIVCTNARVLILGSMPSATSLNKQQYYGHPRNTFWLIMQEILILGKGIDYQQRKQLLKLKGVAIWDVLKSCSREGSMDADIEWASIQINNFIGFFLAYPLIENVFFNGGMAEKIFNKYVLPVMDGQFSYLQYQRLPSTSPAYASMRQADKIAAWQVIEFGWFFNVAAGFTPFFPSAAPSTFFGGIGHLFYSIFDMGVDLFLNLILGGIGLFGSIILYLISIPIDLGLSGIVFILGGFFAGILGTI